MKHVLAIVLTVLAVSCAPNNKGPDTPPPASPGVRSVKATSNMAKQAHRFYGGPSASVLSLAKGLEESSAVKSPLLGFQDAPAERFRPQAVVAGPPLIEPRGLVKGKGFLYISDGGKDESHNEPATIWRVDPVAKKMEIFYRGELLTNSKWLWFLLGADGRSDERLISDFGEETSFHHQGTGVGAKVFAVEVKPDGSAGNTRILHKGAPLVNPQGITVIGNTVILADTRAGEPTHRKDAPDAAFRNGVLYAIPLAGGAPIRLFPTETFVTLVGACTYTDSGQLYLRIWDIDGGLRDTSSRAWMAHSGLVALKRTKVESVSPLKLGPLEDVPFIEEFPITLDLSGFQPNQTVVLKGQNKTTFAGGSETLVVTPESIASGKATFIVESPTSEAAVNIEIIVSDEQTTASVLQKLDIIKDLEGRLGPFEDNKHAGAAVNDIPVRLDTTVDGITRTITLFPPEGGIVANIWQGAPLVTPMASHPSWDDKMIWITDLNGGPAGSGALWQVAMPSGQERALMYSPGNAWRSPKR